MPFDECFLDGSDDALGGKGIELGALARLSKPVFAVGEKAFQVIRHGPFLSAVHLVHRLPWQSDDPAAGNERGQEAFPLGHGEDECRIRGRLLKDLQEGIRSLDAQGLGFMKKDDAFPCEMGLLPEQRIEGAHLGDLYGSCAPVKNKDVRMHASGYAQAGSAGEARSCIRRGTVEQGSPPQCH